MDVVIKAYRAIIASAPVQKDLQKSTPLLVKMLRLLFQTVGRIIPKKAAQWALGIFGRPRSRYKRKPGALFDQADRKSVDSGGLLIHCYVWESPGPSVLLVHGWETGAPHMGSLVKPLLDRGFRVIAMDGPAHGQSQGQSTNLPQFARAINDVISQLGPMAHMIGHSFGGVSSVYAMAISDKPNLDKMVLISVPNSMLRILSDFSRYLKIPAKAQLYMHQLIENTFGIILRQLEISKLGKNIEVNRVLVVHDHTDQVVPFYNALEIVHALPNACLLPCYHAGHNRILKEPQVLNTISEFLAED